MANQVIYVAPDSNIPSGGVRALYRHAEILASLDHKAAIWHFAEGGAPDWFDSPALVLYGETLRFDNTDTLIVPEGFVFAGTDPAPGCRKIIYNQNHFYTFADVAADEYPRWAPQPTMWVSSVMSQNVMRRLRSKLGVTSVHNVPYTIDTLLFQPADVRERKVVWMPRKRPNEAALIQSLFTADNRFDDVALSPIDGLSEQQTAAALGSASVFIALGREEGFGLPVAEALAAGCAVVGYPSGGGTELFDAPGTFAVPDSDVLAIVDQVARLLVQEPAEEERGKYRTWVKETYSEARLRACLQRAIWTALEQPAEAGQAIHPWPQFQETHGIR